LGLSMMLSMTPLVHAQSTNLTGQWKVVRDGKSGTTLLTLNQSGNSITGNWALGKGPAFEIENGKIDGDTLTFSFVHDKEQFNATAHLSGDTMDLDVVELKKGGKSETIHGKATRGSMQ